MSMRVTAIIAAGGKGTRFGGDLKQLRLVGGRAMLDRSVSTFLAHPSIAEVVVAVPPSLVEDPPPYLRAGAKPLRLAAGGERRQDSVANAFALVAPASEMVVVHDAARPLVTVDLITRTIAAAQESGAAVAAVQARDTVKRARSGLVAETIPRETVYLAQTPQAFRRHVLEAALAVAARENVDATDEASLAERAGHAVRIVDGDPSNIKITTPEDLVLAEAISRSAEASRSIADESEGARAFRRADAPARTGRAGTGFDLHRLVEGRPLVLGGITVPSHRGALGHSDADVVCHAITDAILGAVGLGDIGRHFSDTDGRWKDASSLDLLSRAVAMVAEQGYEVGNIDVTVILESPKIAGHVDAMRAAIAGAIGMDAARVSVKGKTNEGVDAIGRGEAIAAHAIALVRVIGN